jgi:hypothetical protein
MQGLRELRVCKVDVVGGYLSGRKGKKFWEK